MTEVKICPAAEAELKKRGKVLSSVARARLATYSEDDQVRWIVNPGFQSLFSRIQEHMWQNFIQGRLSQAKSVNKPKKVIEVPDPPDDPDSDPDDGFMDLFGDD